jgi:glutamate-1-semialdehyde aminotransferase
MSFNLEGKTNSQVYEGPLKDVIAHGALVNSKRAESYVYGPYPTVAKRATGARFWDHNDKQYIDYVCGLGTMYFGYGNRNITAAMANQMNNGVLFSVESQNVIEAGNDLRNIFTHCDRMRFLKSGSDGCSAAVRIARAFTGRYNILSDGYHGMADIFTSLTPPAIGCPPKENLHIQQLMNLDQIDSTVAAIIIEPIILDYSQDRIDYLYRLRDKCKKTGTLLIFDETITAYRWRDYSVARDINLRPDLSVQGKCLANGMPISMVGGRKDVMEADYFISTSFAGEAVTLAAVIECAKLVRNAFSPNALWEKGREFLDLFNSIDPKVIRIEGYPTRGVLRASDDLTKAIFMEQCVEAGVFFGPSWFYSHDVHYFKDEVIKICRGVVSKIKRGTKLKGKMPSSPFASKVRKI